MLTEGHSVQRDQDSHCDLRLQCTYPVLRGRVWGEGGPHMEDMGRNDLDDCLQ